MIRVILTDIEGTTSSISFVHDVLFPYASEHLPGYVRDQHETNPAVAEQLAAVAERSGVSRDDIEGLVEVLQTWIREDRKETPLKALQGMVWEQGYHQGELKGHIYDDAADYLQRWHDRGLRLFVYSSGSVKAQQLIFGHTTVGDFTPCFSGYFDTRIGGKKEADSYRNILGELGVEASTVLFLSDVEAELAAAEEAGMRTAWLVRDGDAPETSRFVAQDFSEVDQLLKTR
ncbi:2,3-diketo-5-methylthiopentyl-1-phosphate enolase-phosphatase [Marinobacter nitratireducens]|uniref:Enolase-phosphatase E1 n=1 Tax=Marinobacter nitratireducens TaxID=1137280 RepID=A0A072N742_9GAMM|nr:acireductone synthase [Marinobacter nitratireducens]KEF32793.1 2,3-diketo-5-methylthiopentyl-1-phosphate enolase-phosphatase [Marinobacter nitratireducens]